ncbi:MAG: serine protease [Kofleriaceae bacterium]
MTYPQVIRVYATSQDPDFDSPWQALSPSSSTGSAVVIEGGLVLTGAHVVANATFLQIQKLSHPDKAIARVRAVSHDCDLALLEVVEPADFLADIAPAQLGPMPSLREKVHVVGYPVGGEEISITEGVVSRIEVQRYSHSQRNLLAVTVDAAINAGNSGGPVFYERSDHDDDDDEPAEVAGIAFQKMNGVDNIGEMVPPPIIKAFVAGVREGREPEVPALGVTTQNLENPLLRARLGLTKGQSGVMVIQVDEGGSAAGHLQVRDVILAIDGLPIANNGTVQYEGRHRTRYDVALVGKYVGDGIRLQVFRAGEVLELELPLRRWTPLVPRSRYDRPTPYFVYGGLVFQSLTRDYLTTWDKWWNKAPKEFLHYYYSGHRTEERHEVVVLTQVLADEINVGYGSAYDKAVALVNGEAPKDLAELVAMIERAEGVVEIVLTSGAIIALDTAEVAAATPRILDRYRVIRDRSPGL